VGVLGSLVYKLFENVPMPWEQVQDGRVDESAEGSPVHLSGLMKFCTALT